MKRYGILWKSCALFAAALFVTAAGLRCGGEKAEKESVTLNRAAFERAKLLIQQGKVVTDQDKAWSVSIPSDGQVNEFIGKHGWADYAKWHLGINESLRETTKQRYKFPFGDFESVYRSALVAAKNRAAQYHYDDIRDAAIELLALIDKREAPVDLRASEKKK